MIRVENVGDIERLRRDMPESDDRQKQDDLESLIEMERELKDFRAELLRVAKLPYKPDLNDGVELCAAPLSKLFQNKPWRNHLEKRWKELQQGNYDWAHIAYAIWPQRVREACKKNKSIAIAHGLEKLYEG